MCVHACVLFIRTCLIPHFLLQDAIKYTKQVGEDTSLLTECLKMMSAIPKRTNDVVHLSALEDFDEPFVELGQLMHQGLLHMAETRALRTLEKERQIFLFTKSILVCKAQKRENGQVRYAFRRKIDLLVRESMPFYHHLVCVIMCCDNMLLPVHNAYSYCIILVLRSIMKVTEAGMKVIRHARVDSRMILLII